MTAISVSKKNSTALLLLLLTALVFTTKVVVPVDAKLACLSTADCEDRLRVGSECVGGFCSNPFVEGCLKTMVGSENDDEDKLPELAKGGLDGRVCNSDDEAGLTFCLDNEFDYFEIRVHNSNWESSIFLAWIMQIMLMEVMRVPVTVGLDSSVTGITSFYSPDNSLQYSSASYPWEALRGATAAFENNSNCEDTTEACAHILPEVWNSQVSEWTKALQDGVIDSLDWSGQVGKLGWYVPEATARKDVSLVSYYGLQGEANRAKLAETFKRPTAWYEYCEEVSATNCTEPDGVAQFYPKTEGQAAKYYEAGNYEGHFRLLPQNNCTDFPTTCTGYMVAPVCTWSTNVDAQLYWNDIVGIKPDGPIEPNHGYGYSSMIEIWKAANATKSDVMMWWWQPDAMLALFSESEYAFQQIILPTVTDVCSKARVSAADRCDADIMVRRGDPLGACDDEAHALRKILSKTLQEKTLAVEQEPSRSPAYEFFRALKVTDLEIQAMLTTWVEMGVDQYGNDAREVVCSWVVDNMEQLLDFVPIGYPRTLDQTGSFKHVYIYCALAVAAICLVGLIVISGLVQLWRKKKVFVYAQEYFLKIILVGFSLSVIGGTLYAVEPTDSICIARSWLTSLGISSVLSAVLVKMSTINRIMQKSKKLKRVQVSRKAMFGSLGVLLLIDITFLIAWTLVAPPKAEEQLILRNELEHNVEASVVCRSSQFIYHYVLEIWHILLLLIASVLAFQSRDTVPAFNESRSIGTMIYSHFLFMILRLIIFILGHQEMVSPNVFGASISLLYSFDTLFATAIYVVPKCFEARKDEGIYDPRQSIRVSTSSSVGRTPNLSGFFPSSAEFNKRESSGELNASGHSR